MRYRAALHQAAEAEPARAIDSLAHRRQVDGDTVVHQAQAGTAVRAAAHCDLQSPVADRGDCVPHVPVAHHGGRPPVDPRVVGLAALVVRRCPVMNDLVRRRAADVRRPVHSRRGDAGNLG